MKEEFGLKYLHNEETFYKLFKISRQDFLEKLEKDPKKAEKVIMKTIYSAKKPKEVKGRHGVLSLEGAIDIIRRKHFDRERENKFAEKFVGDRMSAREFRQ